MSRIKRARRAFELLREAQDIEHELQDMEKALQYVEWAVDVLKGKKINPKKGR